MAPKQCTLRTKLKKYSEFLEQRIISISTNNRDYRIVVNYEIVKIMKKLNLIKCINRQRIRNLDYIKQRDTDPLLRK